MFSTTMRIAQRDIELGGVVIPKNADVRVLIAAGNRDPDAFADADRFDSQCRCSGYASIAKTAWSMVAAVVEKPPSSMPQSMLINSASDSVSASSSCAPTSIDTMSWPGSVRLRCMRSPK
ncbi:hypothetical protein ACVWW4_004246 [Bradyrhizobium sp. LB7.1]